MATKNFLLALVVISLFGCTSAEKRNQQPQPVVLNPATGVVAPGQSTNDVALRSGQVLPVGVYLSAGGMRSFAHIGVLRALQNNKVPIVAVGGMEWGSVIAASFALSRGVNEVEWQMQKLKKDQLPTKTLLKRELAPKEGKDLYDFLRFAFAEKELQKGQIPFTCPTTDGDQVVFVHEGKARDQLLKCTVLPPLFQSIEEDGHRWMAGAVNTGDWAGELRKAGAQYIIYVDVVSSGNLFSSNEQSQETRALWAAVRGISRQQRLFAHITIEIPTDIQLTEIDRRRELIGLGQKAAEAKISEIMKSIGVN